MINNGRLHIDAILFIAFTFTSFVYIRRITITEDTVQDIQVDGISYLFRLRDTFLNSFDEYFTSERLFPLQCLNVSS
jgi:hypothetical protein